MNDVFRSVEVTTTGRSLDRRSPTECGVSECDLETSTMRRSWLSINYIYIYIYIFYNT